MTSKNLSDSFPQTSSSLPQSQIVSHEQVSSKHLQTMGSTILGVTHNALIKASKLLWPVGNTIGLLQNNVGTYMKPFVKVMEDKTLQALGFVDDKLVILGNATQTCVHFASKQARELPLQATSSLAAAADKLHRRGLLGSTADFWVDNELALRSCSEGAANLFLKVPGANLFVPVARATTPLAGMAAAWLLKHSEVKDKHLDVQDGNSGFKADVSPHEDDETCGEARFSDSPPDQAPSSYQLAETLSFEDSLKIPSYEETVKDPLEVQKTEPISKLEEGNNTAPPLSKMEEENNLPFELSKVEAEDDIPPEKGEEPSELRSSEKAVVIQHEEEFDPVMHLFEHSWSLRKGQQSARRYQSRT